MDMQASAAANSGHNGQVRHGHVPSGILARGLPPAGPGPSPAPTPFRQRGSVEASIAGRHAASVRKVELRWERETAIRPEHPLSRPLDILLAVVLIAFLAPVLLIVAAAIWICDPGPVVFAHRRVGRDGRSFECLKFRSMCTNAEARLAALLRDDPALRAMWERDHKLPRDPRVTRIGAFLRVTSLDELPQLFNVLRGDMSLVGPRPIVTAEIPKYGRYIRHYCSVRPGLTGLWQVSGRSSTTYRRRVAADVRYARSRSLGLDMRILFATVPAVITGKGSC